VERAATSSRTRSHAHRTMRSIIRHCQQCRVYRWLVEIRKVCAIRILSASHGALVCCWANRPTEVCSSTIGALSRPQRWATHPVGSLQPAPRRVCHGSPPSEAAVAVAVAVAQAELARGRPVRNRPAPGVSPPRWPARHLLF
jgi:hypothetical protein